ncbi:MAG TPA: Uma2 family endonuclease [Actinomycetota bacterium]
MATHPRTTGYTYADLERFPEDNLRREIIDGELIVTPAPATRHQRVVAFLVHRFYGYAEERGGEVLPAPYDVYFADDNVVEPDVLFIRDPGKLERKYIRSAPDIVVEVSSPSTRRLELVRKRELYERFGVPEYWFVDLDADRVEVYRLEEGRYPVPTLLGKDRTLTSPQVPGLELAVTDLLGPPEGPAAQD